MRLTAQGYERLSVPIVLREKGKDKVLDQKTVAVRRHEQDREGASYCTSRPNRARRCTSIDVPGQEDEVSTDNNRLQRPVFVHEARQIKVLYVEGYRRWEYHYIKTLLERESNRIKGNKSIDLKVLLLDADADFAAQDRSAIAEFPSKAELNTFDVVILGDVDPQSKCEAKMTEHLKDLADFVARARRRSAHDRRRALRAFRLQGFAAQGRVPIDVTDDKPADDAEIRESYRPALTPTGRMHPIFQFGSGGEKENDEIWERLKEMYWYADGYQIKRAAEVLAVHPKKRGAGPRTATARTRIRR